MSASLSSKVFVLLFRIQRRKEKFNARTPDTLAALRARDCPEPPRYFSEKFSVEMIRIRELKVFILRPRRQPVARTVLYLHGGAYVRGFDRGHWRFLEQMIDSTGCTIIAPDYPLVPEHDCASAIDHLLAVYAYIQKAKPRPDLTIMGDSAGGGLGLALSLELKRKGLPGPNRIVLLSPWLDVALRNPEIEDIDDPWLGRKGLQMVGKLYAGKLSLTNPLVSPLYGNMKGLPPLHVFAGTRDLLFPDSKQLCRIARDGGVSVRFYEFFEMTHVWMLFPFPESQQARAGIFEIINDRSET